ncbi:MAG: SDR family NAD(P)-dependent oxidoreductase, partial [Gammaproteobacteria bacterium]|nr:SDR family NAD(P)-dependent oxidoreductase [Gammaproteobacteria bacterium]
MEHVAGKVAFVTGAASGLGLAMARSFAGAGMKVALADIEADALEQAHASFGPGNADTIALPLDVTDRDAMAEAADRTEAAFGKVHVLCN